MIQVSLLLQFVVGISVNTLDYQALREEWLQLSDDTLDKLVESMPRRMAAVARARGGYTRY